MSDHPVGPDGRPFVMPRFLYVFSHPRPCVLRAEATGVEIAGQGRPVVDTKGEDQTFVEFTATWDALPKEIQEKLIEKYGKRKARRDWANVLINAPVEQVHWIKEAPENNQSETA